MSQRPAVLTEEIEELRKKVALLGKLHTGEVRNLSKYSLSKQNYYIY